MVGKAPQAGCLEAGLAGLADGWASSLVLVERGDIADPGMETYAVVVLVDDGPARHEGRSSL